MMTDDDNLRWGSINFFAALFSSLVATIVSHSLLRLVMVMAMVLMVMVMVMVLMVMMVMMITIWSRNTVIVMISIGCDDECGVIMTLS